MKKRINSLILSLLMLLSLISPALAQDTVSSSFISNDIKNQMLRLLVFTEAEKENYGLSNVNFSSVYLGSEIPTYQVSNGALVPADIRLIPITDGKRLLNMFCIATTEDGTPFVQLSNDLIDPLSKYVQNEAFAIIYDSDGVYTYANGKLHLLGLKTLSSIPAEELFHNSTSHSTEITIVDTSSETDVVSMVGNECFSELAIRSCTAPTTVLNASSFADSISPSSPREVTSAFLDVPIMQQPAGTHICWAISLTSILNYMNNTTWNYSVIHQLFNGGVDAPLSTINLVSLLNVHFDAYWGYSHTATLSPSRILSFLRADSPLYGSFETATGGHAVVIRGVSTTLRAFSVMNPTPTTTRYTTGTFSSNDTLSFISLYNGNTYTLQAYAYPS